MQSPSCVTYIALMICFFIFTSSFCFPLGFEGEIPRNPYRLRDGIVRVTHFPYSVGSGIPKQLKAAWGDKALDIASDKIFSMLVNVDEISKRDLDLTAKCILSANNDHLNCPARPDTLAYLDEAWKEEEGFYRSNFQLDWYFAEVLYFRHGLRFCDQRIRDYVKTRDILDIGAFHGDSATILSNYTDKKIYSYELTPSNFRKVQQYVKANGISDKVVMTRKGVDSYLHTEKILDVDSGAATANKNDNGVETEFTTIDHEVETRNLNPGFMKADVEGFGLNAMLGGLKTIQKFRPVIAFATYHNMEEYFGIPDLVKTFPNYIIEYRCGKADTFDLNFAEFGIMAYPAEILYPVFPQKYWSRDADQISTYTKEIMI